MSICNRASAVCVLYSLVTSTVFSSFVLVAQQETPIPGKAINATPMSGRTVSGKGDSASKTSSPGKTDKKAASTADSFLKRLRTNVKEGISSERNKIILDTIERYVQSGEDLGDKNVQKAILNDISKKMSLTPKIPVDRRSYQQIADIAKDLAAKKFNASGKELVKIAEKEADEKFKLAKPLDRVSIRYSRGHNDYEVNGTFFSYGSGYKSVQIEDRYVAMFDMLPKDRAKFDLTFNKRQKKEYVETQVRNYEVRRLIYSQKMLGELLKKQESDNEKNGYIYAWNEWKTPQEIASVYLTEKEKEILAAKLRQAELERRQRALALANNTVEAEKAAEEALEKEEFTEKKEEPVADLEPKADPVLEEKYKELMKKVDARILEIANSCSGIDSDQGYKKALWNMNRSEVAMILAKEEPNTPLKSAIATDTLDFSSLPKGNQQFHLSKVIFCYMNDVFVRLVYLYDNVSFETLPAFKNVLHESYGRTDEEKEDMTAMELTPQSFTKTEESKENMPDDIEHAELDANAEKKEEAPLSDLPEKRFHWKGKHTVGVLTFRLAENGTELKDVIFTKDAPAVIAALEERIKAKKLEEERLAKEKFDAAFGAK